MLSPQHLNVQGWTIKKTGDNGRGVYASSAIPTQTLIEVSPVRFLSKDDEDHGKHTAPDHYMFKWSDGRIALALGLGSLFNHSDQPNVSYNLDASTDSVRYTTVRDIKPNEELCIFYGRELCYKSAESTGNRLTSVSHQADPEARWEGLSAIHDAPESVQTNELSPSNSKQIVAIEDLPFTRFKPSPEEEEMDTVRTVQAWVVDIPDRRQITTLLNWLKQAGLDTLDLGHLKRIRKQDDKTTLLLAASPNPPTLPEDLHLPHPYKLVVPAAPALTPISLRLKCSLWPTLYTPPKKDETEEWPQGKVGWAWKAMKTVVDAANKAQTRGELPIAAHIAAPYEDGTQRASIAFTACDSRNSSAHPLRHAVLNVIRRLADHRTAEGATRQTAEIPKGSTPSLLLHSSDEVSNGTNYLLTSLSLFTTHEPCIMCSMALIHSRVKEVFYLHPMPKTGGCGGIACLPTLKGVNHRFGICQWKAFDKSTSSLHIDASIDA